MSVIKLSSLHVKDVPLLGDFIFQGEKKFQLVRQAWVSNGCSAEKDILQKFSANDYLVKIPRKREGIAGVEYYGFNECAI